MPGHQTGGPRRWSVDGNGRFDDPLMRPILSEAEAALFSRDDVLRYTGTAGAERIDPWVPHSLSIDWLVPDYVVGPDQACASVHAALARALAEGRTGRVIIGVTPGIHVGLIYIPKLPFAVTLMGLGRCSEQVRLVENIDAQMPSAEYKRRFGAQFDDAPEAVRGIFQRIAAGEGIITTAQASVMRIESDDFQLVNLTVRNSYNADRAQPGADAKNAAGQYTTGQHQAVAVLVAGADRVQIQDVDLKSFQDTLYLQSPAKGETVRTCLTGCDIEGDVDFIFGQSTAWFEGCTIRSLGSRAAQAWATAPSTDLRTRFGFVFNDCDFVHDASPTARAGAFRLGRQWFEGVRATPYGGSPVAGYRCVLGPVSAYDPPEGTIGPETLSSVGKCVIMRSRIGAHIHPARPWDDWSGSAWNPRHRPAQYRAGDMLHHLAGWLSEQGVDYSDVDPNMVLLGEYENTQPV